MTECCAMSATVGPQQLDKERSVGRPVYDTPHEAAASAAATTTATATATTTANAHCILRQTRCPVNRPCQGGEEGGCMAALPSARRGCAQGSCRRGRLGSWPCCVVVVAIAAHRRGGEKGAPTVEREEDASKGRLQDAISTEDVHDTACAVTMTIVVRRRRCRRLPRRAAGITT